MGLFEDMTPHEIYRASQGAILDAQQMGALNNLQEEFAGYHAQHIAPVEASIRTGAIALLSATGTQVEHGLLNPINRRIYSSGFLIAGDIESDNGSHMAPVVKLDAPTKSASEYHSFLMKSFQRDRFITPPPIAKIHTRRITKALQPHTLHITSGTIFNKQPEVEQAKPFVQGTARRLRPTTSHFHTPTAFEGFIGRRWFGEMIRGFYIQDQTFRGPSADKLTSHPATKLPTLQLPPQELLELANSDAKKRTEAFETVLADAMHNEHAARRLFEGASMAAGRITRRKPGRLFWNGNTSILQKLRPIGPSKHNDPLILRLEGQPESE